MTGICPTRQSSRRASHQCDIGDSGQAEQHSGRKPTNIPGMKVNTIGERSDADLLIFRDLIDFLNINYPERSGGGRPDARMGVRG
jgi:hypothetical protein